jgi:hypothetical protein
VIFGIARVALLGFALLTAHHVAAADAAATATDSLGNSDRLPAWCAAERWSYQVGVAYVSGSSIDELMLANGNRPANGQIYLLQASYLLDRLHPELFGRHYELDVSLPLVLGVVDEHGSDAFVQYSGGVTLRWKKFPWNRWLYTNLETGLGLTYSQHVLAIERERHSDRQRSHVEFYWPVQLLLAHPSHRQHQFALFLHHHSGGWIFHEGGANSLGIGYRYAPGEK